MKLDFSKVKDFSDEMFPIDQSETLPDFEFNGTAYRFKAPVKLSGTYFLNETGLTISGEITAKLVAPCDRCLIDTDIPLVLAFDEMFSSADTEDTYPLLGTTVDLTQAVMDNIVLNLPLHLLCKHDCKGLCPHCGKNRNKEKCNCEIEMKSKNSPFASLDGLFKD